MSAQSYEQDIREELLSLDVSTPEAAFEFLVSVLFSQGQRAEAAWRGPQTLRSRLKCDKLSPETLVHIPLAAIEAAMSLRPAVHRFPRMMATLLSNLTVHLMTHYQGDARSMWTPAVGGNELLLRLQALPGYGAHKAKVAAFLLSTAARVCILDDGAVISITECPKLASQYWMFPEAPMAPAPNRPRAARMQVKNGNR